MNVGSTLTSTGTINASNTISNYLSWTLATGTSATTTNLFTTNLKFNGATGSYLNVGTITNNSGSLLVPSTANVLINPSGNVGIGTSTPNEKLTMIGNIQNTM